MDISTTVNSTFLTIDVGGTNLKSAVFNDEGKVMKGSLNTIKTFSNGSKEKILSAFKKTVINGLEFISNKGMKLNGIGVAFPGPFDYSKGISLMKHKFLNIYGVNLRKFFQQIPGILPEIPINFIHDVHAVLLGELWKGNARGFSDSAVVTLGTGLGFAFSKGGIIQSNRLGGPLVTIYSLPYKDGILEDYAGRNGFLKIYSEISSNNIDGIDVSDLGKWATMGDSNSIRTFYEVGRILSGALHNILIERNIRCLLLGGQISKSFQYLEGSLKEGLMDIEGLSKISVVKSIELAPLLGAYKVIPKEDLKYNSII